MYFLDAKKTFDRDNHWTLAKKLLDRNVPLHIVKLFIFGYGKQEYMVRWGNSLSRTFHYSNRIREGGQLSKLLYNVYTDDINHHIQATGVGCYVEGAWANSLSYADDMVLLALRKLLIMQTVAGMSRICWTSWHCIQYNENSMYVGPTKAITTSVLNKSQARRSETWLCSRVSLPMTCHDCRLSTW